MKAGSEKKLVKKNSDTQLTDETAKVGRPEQELSMDKPLNVAKGTLKSGFVRLSVHRAFSILDSETKETYAGKEGDVVDVPGHIAEELERGFLTNYAHEGSINMKNARRNTIQRATRI
jgi:hypothetical protein